MNEDGLRSYRTLGAQSKSAILISFMQTTATNPKAAPTRTKIISVALVVASSVSVLGAMIYVNGSRYSNAFFDVMGILYLPGLIVAAVVGGALGLGGIHDPSLVLAGILNFLFYGLGLFFVLKNLFKSKKRADSSAGGTA